LKQNEHTHKKKKKDTNPYETSASNNYMKVAETRKHCQNLKQEPINDKGVISPIAQYPLQAQNNATEETKTHKTQK
jgi:hypothetical protein